MTADTCPLFSVIVVDYEGSVTRDELRRCMAQFAQQTCDDFELLVYHDGPKSTSYADDLAGCPVPARARFMVTERRANDWGHSNRDRGIHEAVGEWIVLTNADNVHYPNLIATLRQAAVTESFFVARDSWLAPRWWKSLSKRLDKLFKTRLRQKCVPRLIDTPSLPDVLVYGIILQGEFAAKSRTVRIKSAPHLGGMILSGFPIRPGRIDAMQFVMRRKLWLAEGGWHARHTNSDGALYTKFAQKYLVKSVPHVLAEHW